VKLLLLSDTHLTPRAPGFSGNWDAARAWIARTRPDMTIHLGDITADGAHDAGELRAARDQFNMTPGNIRFLPGNHDIGDNPIAPPNEHSVDLKILAEYRREFGADRWSVEADGWQIVGLNAQLLATGTEEEEVQFAWLEQELSRGRGKLVLILHKPLFRDEPADSPAHKRYVPIAPRTRLLSILRRRQLCLVASGHVHQFRHLRHDGVDYLWVPSAAYTIADTAQERIGDKIVGVISLELTGDGHSFELVTPDGLAQHRITDYPHIYPRYGSVAAT